MAEREGREYKPVTERGAVVHAARQAHAAFREMRERLDIAREIYGAERDAGQGRVTQGKTSNEWWTSFVCSTGED